MIALHPSHAENSLDALKYCISLLTPDEKSELRDMQKIKEALTSIKDKNHPKTQNQAQEIEDLLGSQI